MKDFFVEDILEKFEDYTQPVNQGPSSMEQEPRNMYVAGGVIKAAKKFLTQTPKPKPSILKREAVPLNLTQINEISKNKEFEHVLNFSNSFFILKGKKSSLAKSLKVSWIPRYVIFNQKNNIVLNNAPRPSKSIIFEKIIDDIDNK